MISLDTFLHSGEYKNIQLEIKGGLKLPYQDYHQPRDRSNVELYFFLDKRTTEYEAYRDVDLDLDISDELSSGSPLVINDNSGNAMVIYYQKETD